MIYITTPIDPTPPARYTRSEAITFILRRLDYSIDEAGVVYSSSEDGGIPLGTLASVTAAVKAHRCLGPRAVDGTYGRPDATACSRLDRALLAGALAPAA